MTDLVAKAAWLRRELFEMVMRAGQGHLPSSFSCVDILVALYYGDVLKPEDKVIISKGHAAMAVYPILADLGCFPKEELDHFTEPGALLSMYPDRRIPGIEVNSGSLGHGLGIGAGMALADRSRRVFVLLGDGECYEGSVWEAAAFAAHHQLSNLVAIVDRNQMSILGETEKLLKLGVIVNKFFQFGWGTAGEDGHSHFDLGRALKHMTKRTEPMPFAIIARTIKGKGVSFMENRPEWHARMPNAEQTAQAREELAC